MTDMRLKENAVVIIRDILAAKLVNPKSTSDVTADDIFAYLDEYTTVPEGTDRVKHFKKWLDGEIPEFNPSTH